MICKVKAIKHLGGVYPSLQPVIGKVYDADLKERTYKGRQIAVITINNKLIALRQGEYERVE